MIRPIRNEEDYETALEEIEALWEAPSGTPEADRLELLVMLVEAYEAEHYPIPAPNPIALILHVMDARGLTRRDLEPYLGSRARVSEILNRRRPLSLEMIRKLQTGLGLPADVLVQPYELQGNHQQTTAQRNAHSV
jgi:HTH-type transcriptional regulator / antitoxin HigA